MIYIFLKPFLSYLKLSEKSFTICLTYAGFLDLHISSVIKVITLTQICACLGYPVRTAQPVHKYVRHLTGSYVDHINVICITQ